MVEDDLILLKIKEILENTKYPTQVMSSAKIGEIVAVEISASRRKIRDLIKKCIYKYKLPVGATSEGYGLLMNKDHLSRYMNDLNERQMQILSRGKKVFENFNEFYKLQEENETIHDEDDGLEGDISDLDNDCEDF